MLLVIQSEHKLAIYTYFSLSYVQGTSRGLIEAYERNVQNFEVFIPFNFIPFNKIQENAIQKETSDSLNYQQMQVLNEQY